VTLVNAEELIRVIRLDPLAPYVVMAFDDGQLAARLTSPDTQPGYSQRLSLAALRHLELLQLVYEPSQGSAKLQPQIDAMVPIARTRLESDRTSPDPLTRYLYLKRRQLGEMLLENRRSAADTALRTWSEIRSDPILSQAFDEHMIRRRTKELAIYPKANMARLIADIGAGPGHYAIDLLSQLSADWRAVVSDCYEDAGWLVRTASPELRERIDVLHDDFSDRMPMGTGIYILGSILHNLDDADALGLLWRCRKALNNASELLIIERRWNPRDLADSSRDLDMHILFGGRERTDRELAELLNDAGFTHSTMTATTDGYRIMTGTAASEESPE